MFRYGVRGSHKLGIGTALEPIVLVQGGEAVAAETHPLGTMIFRAHELHFFRKDGFPYSRKAHEADDFFELGSILHMRPATGKSPHFLGSENRHQSPSVCDITGPGRWGWPRRTRTSTPPAGQRRDLSPVGSGTRPVDSAGSAAGSRVWQRANQQAGRAT